MIPETDILYVLLREGSVEDTMEVVEDVFMELDEKGKIIGIEIWYSSKNVLEPLIQAIATKLKQRPKAKPQSVLGVSFTYISMLLLRILNLVLRMGIISNTLRYFTGWLVDDP